MKKSLKTAAIAGGTLALGSAGLALYISKLAKDLQGIKPEISFCGTDMCTLCPESRTCPDRKR